MKNIFKLSLSLLANQFLASIGGFMCIIFVWLIAGETIYAHMLFLLITFSFFIYIELRAAYKYGYSNPDRRNKPQSKSYIFKGALSGLISSIPLMILIFIYIFTRPSSILISETAKLYSRIICMYYSWPMCNIFPNHVTAVLLSSLIWLIVLPMIGYIAGYKNFDLN